MEPTLEKFGHFVISRRGDEGNVELRRTDKDVVLLAFDSNIKRLVELHILSATLALSETDRAEVLQRCKLAMDVRGPGCMRMLECGKEDDTIFYSSNLSDGEFAEAYVTRRGPVPPVTVFCMMQQFLEDLLATPNFENLVNYVSLVNPLITTLEDSFLQLRIVDYCLTGAAPEENGTRRVVAECCQLLFLLLTGQRFNGHDPDQVPALTCLPTSLRMHLRSALLDPAQASPLLEKLRDDVREAYAALVTNLQVRTSRRHIVVTESLQPKSLLKDLLLDEVPLAELLNGRFEAVSGEESSRHPFSIAAVNLKTEQTVTVHLLPPSRVVPRDQYEAVPLQMWRFSPERHPNILRSLSVWENPAWTFLTEEREPGFSLGRLMAERIILNPTEVLALLRQVRAGLDQALECGVRSADLHPSNLLLRVGKGGPMQAREFERLMQKRIDAWPPFNVKLRTHMTMRSLYEPPLVELGEDGEGRDLHLAERELRHRAFLGLAVYLLTGERQAGKKPNFGESVSEPLAGYLHSCLELSGPQARTPSPAEFVDAFEQYMTQTAGPEGRGIAAIMAASAAAGVETESAGAISDFDEDWSDGGDDGEAATTTDYLQASKNSRKSFSVPTLSTPQKTVPGRAGIYIWAASAALLVMLGRFALFGGSHATVSAPPAVQEAAAPPTGVRSAPAPVVAAHLSSAPDSLPSPSGAKALPQPAPAPVVAASPAPQPHVEAAPPAPKPVVSTPLVVASAPPVPKAFELTPVAVASAPPSPKPVESAPVVAASTPPAPTPVANPPVTVASKPVETQPSVNATPKAPEFPAKPVEEPITIKKAIVPNSKEVGEARKDSSGAVLNHPAVSRSLDVVDGATADLR